jgi:hypothetical protein
MQFSFSSVCTTKRFPVWRQFTFANITTSTIRVLVNNSLTSYSRIVEVQAYEAGGSPTPTPSATATPTPCVAIVPNLLGIRLKEAQAVWQAAGFTTTLVMDGPRGQEAVWQSIPAGTAADCNSTVITVNDRSQ